MLIVEEPSKDIPLIALAAYNLEAVAALPFIFEDQVASPSVSLFFIKTYPASPPIGNERSASSKKNNWPSSTPEVGKVDP